MIIRSGFTGHSSWVFLGIPQFGTSSLHCYDTISLLLGWKPLWNPYVPAIWLQYVPFRPIWSYCHGQAFRCCSWKQHRWRPSSLTTWPRWRWWSARPNAAGTTTSRRSLRLRVAPLPSCPWPPVSSNCQRYRWNACWTRCNDAMTQFFGPGCVARAVDGHCFAQKKRWGGQPCSGGM